MEKRISVIIPVHNAEHILEDCLKSIFQNNYPNFEVIVVDDCSSDHSIPIALHYPCKIIQLTEQHGPAFARDIGATNATGEIVAFLDSDCITPTDWLKHINEKLTKEMAGIGGAYKTPDEIQGLLRTFLVCWDMKHVWYISPRNLISFSGGNCAFWKSVLNQERPKKELAYFHKKVGGEDTLMCWELSQFGKLIYDPNLYVVHQKRITLKGLIKEVIWFGASGMMVSRFCAKALAQEPHRMYKTLLYFLAVVFLLTLPFLLYRPTALLLFLLFYILTTLPIIFSVRRQGLLNTKELLAVPLVVFIPDILHAFGQLLLFLRIIQKKIKKAWWGLQLAFNVINPHAISKIFFFVTEQCNANCAFCFHKTYEAQDHQRKKELTLEEIEKVTLKLSFVPWLLISGGEPFLRKDLDKVVALFYKNCQTRFLTIVTNGLLPQHIETTVERMLLNCKTLQLTVNVALDGIKEEHDRLKNVPGCFTKVLNTVERLQRLAARHDGLSIGINTMLMKDNKNKMAHLIRYVKDTLKCERHYLNLPRQPSRMNKLPDFISLEEYRGLSLAANSSQRSRLYNAFAQYCYDTTSLELKKNTAIHSCRAAKKFFVIDEAGEVFACEILGTPLGNLRNDNYDLKRIAKNAETKKLRNTIIKNRCYCQWPCAAACNAYLNIVTYPKILARFFPSRKTI